MSLKVKIDRKELRYLLNIIQYASYEAYLLFDHDGVKISFLSNDKTIMHKINLDYESYFYNLRDNEIKTIAFNPRLLLFEISKITNKFIKLSVVSGNNCIKIESTK